MDNSSLLDRIATKNEPIDPSPTDTVKDLFPQIKDQFRLNMCRVCVGCAGKALDRPLGLDESLKSICKNFRAEPRSIINGNIVAPAKNTDFDTISLF